MATRPEPPVSALIAALAASFFLLATGGSARAESAGLALGDGRLHATFETETHQLVNPGYAPASRAVDDACLVVRPLLRFEGGADRLAVEASGDVEYRRYLGLESSETIGLSTLAGHLGLALEGNRGAAVSWRLHERLGRQADSANQTNGFRLLHLTDDVGAGVDWRPGGGALLLTGEYALWYDRYDRSQPALVTPSALDNLTQRPTLRATWKFLPRTALLAEAQGVLTTYTGDAYRDDRTGTTAKNPSTAILLTYLGAVGSITSRVSALAKVGYGDNFLAGDRVRTVVGQAELAYGLTEKSKVRVGFARGIAPTSFFKYVVVDRPYLALHQLLFRRSSVDAKVEYGRVQYGRAIAGTQLDRADRTLAADVAIEHHLGDWLTLALVERLEWRASTYRAPGGERVGYTVNDVFLRVGVDLDGVAALVTR